MLCHGQDGVGAVGSSWTRFKPNRVVTEMRMIKNYEEGGVQETNAEMKEGVVK